MNLSSDVICRTCKRVFCCNNCCLKHEMKSHGIFVYGENNGNPKATRKQSPNSNVESVHVCPICVNNSLPLITAIPQEILTHIEQNHLPLQCEKCFKMYNDLNDLKEFTKCFNAQSNSNCTVEQEHNVSLVPGSNKSYDTNELSKITVKKSLPLLEQPSLQTMTQTISTQTTPTIIGHENKSIQTPSNNVVIHAQLKLKTGKGSAYFSSDHSVSSIKNMSSLCNHSTSMKSSIVEASLVKRKVIRSTSTPLQLEMMKMSSKCKSNEYTFTGGGISTAQISSICVNESDASNLVRPLRSSSCGVDINYRHRKTAGAVTRTKMLAITPLRHVMSKSIQKAIAAQGLINKLSLDELEGKDYCFHSEQKNSQITSPTSQPLDLRLSPALRRNNDQDSIVITESIVITTRTKHLTSSINYNHPTTESKDFTKSYSHHSKTSSNRVQIITTNIENNNFNDFNENICNNNCNEKTPITRIPGAVLNKKLINFEKSPSTEDYCNSSKSRNSSSDSNNETFFTPNTTLTSSCENGLSLENDQYFKRDVKNDQLLQSFEYTYNNDYIGTTPKARNPRLQHCAHTTAFSHIKDGQLENDDICVEKENVEQQEICKRNDDIRSSTFWSLMSSIIRFSSLNKVKSCEKNKSVTYESSINSILHKCTSILSSTLVKSSGGEVNNSNKIASVQSLKRKRPANVNIEKFSGESSQFLSSLNCSVSPSSSDSSNISIKRFRIQGRRPIRRLRVDN